MSNTGLNLYINQKIKLNIPAGYIFKNEVKGLFSIVSKYNWRNKYLYILRDDSGQELKLYRDEVIDLYDKGYLKENTMLIKKILTEDIKELGLKAGQVIYTETTEVQSILFDKSKWNKAQAKQWTKEHGFKVSDMDIPETGDYIHFRQEDPDDYKRFRVSDEGTNEGIDKLLAKGIKFTFGIE